MSNQSSFSGELSGFDKDRLNEASSELQYGDYESPGLVRYSFYRRKGHAPADAFQYALIWSRNAVEQKSRRLAHETGAENWR